MGEVYRAHKCVVDVVRRMTRRRRMKIHHRGTPVWHSRPWCYKYDGVQPNLGCTLLLLPVGTLPNGQRYLGSWGWLWLRKRSGTPVLRHHNSTLFVFWLVRSPTAMPMVQTLTQDVNSPTVMILTLLL